MIDQHPEPTPSASQPTVGYCRSCGKPLTTETMRQALGTLYCPEHVPTAATPPPVPDPYPSPYASATAASTVQNPDISPGLAFFLGLIPGVGAIYNGQYGKGLIHALILGTLITLAKEAGQSETIFELMSMAFFFYMAFEAYHTARRRRDGLPVDEFSSLLNLRGNTSLAGPLILICLGIFFLLNSLELISVRQLVRWWPMGLIALGCFMLYSRLGGSAAKGGSAPPTSPLSSGEVAHE